MVPSEPVTIASASKTRKAYNGIRLPRNSPRLFSRVKYSLKLRSEVRYEPVFVTANFCTRRPVEASPT